MQNENFLYTKKGKMIIVGSSIAAALILLGILAYFFKWWPFNQIVFDKESINKYAEDLKFVAADATNAADSNKAKKMRDDTVKKIDDFVKNIEKFNDKTKDDSKIKAETIKKFSDLSGKIKNVEVKEGSSYAASDFVTSFNDAAKQNDLDSAFTALKADRKIA
ncbi:hypothetical protein [Candidatus Phytoplasma oryzae]|uniref:Immunodominant membrane protein n=1 Tax=Candidatus Phytoplasma oryzae TaxID=203274 RepID=B9X0Z4_9MOLU|nr:hypothetical protein PIE28_01370 [Candidatus Phytoplasma oryzae]BAH24241.1 immunodominant membrane protein [Candidatus Phytoplasma oryzae]